jgi:4-alpha-glucanotransferase
MPWALIRLALESTARLAVVSAQDLLGLDSASRMNTPGTDQGNWHWQAPAGAFDHHLATRIHALATATHRLR